MRGYELRRRNARAERDRRYREILQRIPAYQELDGDNASTISSFITDLKNDTADAARTRDALAEAGKRRRALLSQAGFPADYLDSVYTCAECRDTGFINGVKCRCFVRQEIDLLYSRSHLEALSDKMDFSMLREDLYNGNDEALTHFRGARDAALSFTERFPACDKDLLFMGNVGTGKTTLSVCIAKELLKKGYSVIYFSAVSLFDQLAAAHFSKDRSEADSEPLRDLYSCDLLIIDDLGSELTNSFIEEELFVLLNERQIRDKRIIISTNASVDNLRSTYRDRIFSRIISGFSILKLTGTDIRFRKAVM